MTKKVFLYAQMTCQEKQMCHEIVCILGDGAVSRPNEDMYVSDSTHIVISKSSAKRVCSKVIGALGSGKFVIISDYMKACQAAGHFVDEWEYVPANLQHIIRHVRTCGRVFENTTAIVFLKETRRNIEIKNILRCGGANVLNWSTNDLVFKPLKDLCMVDYIFTDMSPLSDPDFKTFIAIQAAIIRPVTVLSYFAIFKWVMNSPDETECTELKETFLVTNKALMQRLHPNAGKEPILQTQPATIGLPTRIQSVQEVFTLDSSDEDEDEIMLII
jgi:hypothetical protein